jgi:hypothetical protein
VERRGTIHGGCPLLDTAIDTDVEILFSANARAGLYALGAPILFRSSVLE